MVNLTPFFQKHFPGIFKTEATASNGLRPVNNIIHKPPHGAVTLAFWFEQEVSVFSDIVLTLQQEVFRRGFKWTPRWVHKCMTCGAKYHEKKAVCNCGSSLLVEPDSSQLQGFNHESGKSYLEKADLNGNSFKMMARDAHRNLNISDHGYILIIKKYIQDEMGNIITAKPVEILSVDPRTISEIRQKNGIPGGKYWTCLEHRGILESKPGNCPQCGKMLYDVLFETTDKKYYIRDEVRHFNLYYLDGFPPILKILDDAYAYHFLEKRTRNTYEKGRGAGIFMFPTNNPESLRVMWEQVNAKWEEDPDFVPAIGYDAGQGKGVAQYIKLLDDPNPALLEVKKDIRERIMSFFEISPVFMADTSASGGLNNEGQQITVTNRGIEFNQSIWNGDPETFYADGVLAWICDQFGITDYVLQLNPSEERDEMAEKQRLAQDIQNARGMYDMGFDVKYEEGKFIFSGAAKPKPEPQSFGMPGLPMPAPASEPKQSISGAPPNMHKSFSYYGGLLIDHDTQEAVSPDGKRRPLTEKEKAEMKRREKITEQKEDIVEDELAEYQGDELIKSFADDAIKAIRQGALYSFYADVNPELIPKIHEIIKQAFLSHRLSLKEMIEKMTGIGLDYEKARMIARTESTGVAMKAREIGWRSMEKERGEVFKYKAVITNDHRTAPISKRIKAAVDREGGAVSLDRLKAIYKEESTKPYIKGDLENSGMGSDWSGWENFVGHPYERDSIVRVV